MSLPTGLLEEQSVNEWRFSVTRAHAGHCVGTCALGTILWVNAHLSGSIHAARSTSPDPWCCLARHSALPLLRSWRSQHGEISGEVIAGTIVKNWSVSNSQGRNPNERLSTETPKRTLCDGATQPARSLL